VDNLKRSQRNWFTSAELDRLAYRRTDGDWLTTHLKQPQTRFLVTWRSSHLFRATQPLSPAWLNGVEHSDLLDEAESVVLLGQCGQSVYFNLDLPTSVESYPERFAPIGQFADLYDAGTGQESADAALLAVARGLAYWHQRHIFCGTCGQPTQSDEAGHLRRCTSPTCGARFFPRTDPAVIVLVYDDERCLLARQSNWPARMYSVVAGFVEPGECLEETVKREVAEETGVEVTDVEYRSSQPWPFPSSLMFGFRARAVGVEIDLSDDELETAYWFTRRQLVDAVGQGELRVPSRVSISYRLVEEWFDAGEEGPLSALADAVEGA